jgi:hypothetical protein
MLCLMTAVPAFASDSDSVWIAVSDSGNQQKTAAVMSNAAVTDGVIVMVYDSSILNCEDISISEEYIGMYSVNTSEAGVIRVSWVAPETVVTSEGNHSLIEVTFTGEVSKVTEDSIVLSGKVYNAGGEVIPVGKLDLTALQETIAAAEGKEKDSYTEDSYAALESALEAARKVLSTPAGQDEVDAAVKALQAAIDGLTLKTASGETQAPESSTEATNPGGNTEQGTTSGNGTSGGALTGDNTAILPMVVTLMAAGAAIAVVLVMKRRNAK